MGLMDKAMDKALEKMDGRFGELRQILLEMLAEQRTTNNLLRGQTMPGVEEETQA